MRRFFRPGTLLNSRPHVLVGLAVVGFLAAKWLPSLSPLLYMVGVMVLAAMVGVAALLAVDRYLLPGLNLCEAIVERQNLAVALLLFGFAVIIAAGVLGVAIMGVTILQ